MNKLIRRKPESNFLPPIKSTLRTKIKAPTNPQAQYSSIFLVSETSFTIKLSFAYSNAQIAPGSISSLLTAAGLGNSEIQRSTYFFFQSLGTFGSILLFGL